MTVDVNALNDLDFGGMFSESNSTAVKSTSVDNDVVIEVANECFRKVCEFHKLDPDNTTTKSFNDAQKVEMLIQLTLKFVDRGHSKQTCMSLLQKFGVYEETDRTRIWNKAKQQRRNELLKREFGFDANALQNKSVVGKLYNHTPEKPLHHNFVTEIGRGRGAKRKVSILAEIGYAPYKAVMEKAAEVRQIGKSDDLGGYSPEEFAELYDGVKKEIDAMISTVYAKVKTVKDTITDQFGGSGSRSMSSISVDDTALAAFTIGGTIGSAADDTEDAEEA